MILSLLALAAAQAGPAAAPRPDYAASGSEPFWALEIRGRRIWFSPNDGSASDDGITAALPRRQPVRGGYNLATRRYTVQVRHRTCEDEAERRYRDTVTVTLGRRVYRGCGGTLLPPAMLERTDWRIEAIGSVRVDGEAYAISFNEGRISAQAGCNRLAGTFTQRGDRLIPGAIAATRMACPGARMAHERQVLRLLAGPARIAFPAGDAVVLTGSGVTVRLRRV